jgi:ferritin-like metal-binding protein YciE
MPIASLTDLLIHTLRDVAQGERLLARAFPKIASHLSDPALRAAVAAQGQQALRHLDRAETTLHALSHPPRRARCDTVACLIDEAEALMAKVDGPAAMDVGLTAVCRAIKRYEIARYEAMQLWASRLGLDDAAAQIEASLGEKRAADEGMVRAMTDATDAAA